MTQITRDAVLKKLNAIYWRAFHGNKWHIALQVLELQEKNCGLSEKESLPKGTPIVDMVEEEELAFIDTFKKLDLKSKHPPPPMAVVVVSSMAPLTRSFFATSPTRGEVLNTSVHFTSPLVGEVDTSRYSVAKSGG